jgi:hypothetical protein
MVRIDFFNYVPDFPCERAGACGSVWCVTWPKFDDDDDDVWRLRSG